MHAPTLTASPVTLCPVAVGFCSWEWLCPHLSMFGATGLCLLCVCEFGAVCLHVPVAMFVYITIRRTS